MVDLAQVTSLIGAIYEGAVEGRDWPEILQRSLVVIGGCSAVLYSNHSKEPALPATIVCSAGADPYVCSLYAAHYQELGPVLVHERRLPAGAVFAASDTLPAEELGASAFFNGWLAPQGCIDFLVTVLERSSDCVVRLLVARHEQQGPVDERARHALALLAPHLQRAIRMGKLLERSDSRASALSAALEQMATAVILVGRDGRLVHANRAGLQRLAEADVVHWSSGGLRLRSAALDTQLQALLAGLPRTLTTAECASDTAGLLERRDGERSVLRLLPLRACGRECGSAAQTAAAAILIAEHVPDLSQRLQSAVRHFALTPAEGRVVAALMGGCTIGSIARRLGITAATVKTHLPHVFDKTDTRRQVDLVKRIADHVPQRPLQRSLSPQTQLGLRA